jgi:hypothetical protein
VSEQNKDKLLSPVWFALGGFFTTPVLAIILLLGCVLMFITWPFVPMLFYMKRKSELQQTKEVKP